MGPSHCGLEQVTSPCSDLQMQRQQAAEGSSPCAHPTGPTSQGGWLAPPAGPGTGLGRRHSKSGGSGKEGQPLITEVSAALRSTVYKGLAHLSTAL